MTIQFNYEDIESFKYLNIFEYLKRIICEALVEIYSENILCADFIIEFPKDKSHGDFSTNVAMVFAKKLSTNPRQIATALKEKLSNYKCFVNVDIAGPGFINIRVDKKFWFDFATLFYANPESLGIYKKDNKKILIEFVSTNPTGPMHVGHTRGAIFGDALSNIFEFLGYDVTREYFINDVGGQTITLAKSLMIRYVQLCGKDAVIEEGMYPGEYLISIAEQLKDDYGLELLDKSFDDNFPLLRQFGVNKIMNLIKDDLYKLNVTHNSFISELHDVHEKGYVAKALTILRDKGLIYQGVLEPPKGITVDDWESKEQTIFRSTEFGDDVDRVVQRSDGTFTYFAGDLGLVLQRIERGFNEIILTLGADHIGFIKRLKAIVHALSDGKAYIDLPITQLVNLYKDDKPFKMSKRSGNFITAQDVIDEVGIDALRFILLSRKNDTVIDFDFEKVKEQSKENPVFYVQYAHARCSSILRNAEEEFGYLPDINNITLLSSPHDYEILSKILSLPKVIEQAAVHREPHRIIYYLIELATEFHALWSHGNSQANLRFIIPNDKNLTEARLILVDSVRLTIKNTLKLLGIKALEKM